MKRHRSRTLASGLALAMSVAVTASGAELIHDAEQTLLEEQFGEKWAAQDKEIQAKLQALEKKHGSKPNIIHIMWDDNSFGEVGIPVFNKIRGFDTPNLNKMGQDGLAMHLFAPRSRKLESSRLTTLNQNRPNQETYRL